MTDVNDVLPLAGGDFSTAVPDGVVVSTMSGFDAPSEDSMARRYGRLERKQESLTFEFTRDPALVHQYYRIYEEEFRAVHNARYHHDEDEHDRKGHILVVRRGNFCVGGARMSVRTPRNPNPLPIEMGGFRLEDHFPELGQKQMRYAQIGRFCLLPEFRGGAITRMLLWRLYKKAVALGVDVIFGTAPLSNARAYMKNFVAMELKDPKIHFEIDLPPYPMCEEIKFYLLSVVVDKAASSGAEVTGDKTILGQEQEV